MNRGALFVSMVCLLAILIGCVLGCAAATARVLLSPPVEGVHAGEGR